MDIASLLKESGPWETGSDWGTSKEWHWKGFRCHWRVLGEGNIEPLLLLHGFGASSSHWRNNASTFASAGFRVYALDLIGFGRSDQPLSKKYPLLNNHFWSKQIAAFLEEIVNIENIDKAIIIGNSLGALSALTTLVLRPELVKAVIAAPLPDPTLIMKKQKEYVKRDKFKKIRMRIINIFWNLIPLEIIVPLISRTFLIKLALQAAYSKSIESDHELQRIVTRPSQKANAPKALRAMCKGMSLRPRFSKAAALLKKLLNSSNHSPVLLIWGQNDRLVPVLLGQKLVKEYPNLDLSILESTGHCPHDERPEQFNKIVLDWIELNVEKPEKA